MDPISELDKLLSELTPHLEAGEFVFCSVPSAAQVPVGLEPFATVREAEGLTLVVSAEQAHRVGLPFQGLYRLISLQVYSSLDAVGLTAAVAKALADEGISANVIAGYHHDHLLVPVGRSGDALTALARLAGVAARSDRHS